MAIRAKGEGTMYKHKTKDMWIGQYYDGTDENGKAIRKTIYAKTKQELVKKLNDVMYKKNNMLYIEKTDITLMEIIEKNREEKFEANIIGEGQYLRLKWTENRIKESKIANIPIQKLKGSDIQEFLNSNKNFSDSYIKKMYELINSACKKAIKKKLILENPMDDVIKPNSNNIAKDIRALTVDEQTKLTDYLKSVRLDEERYKLCLMLEMYMGLRVGEALALQVSDIDLKNGYIKINKTLTLDVNAHIKMNNRAKTYAGRRKLPIPDIVRNELKEQVKIAKNNRDELLFECNGEYVRPNSVNSVLKRIFRRQLGLSDKDISTHSLRHTYATRCIEAGMNAVVLQRLMGHTDVKITLNTYTSVFNEFKEDEISKVTKYINKKIINNKSLENEL